ncbi:MULTISPECIES: LysR family transcriptional regulator [unclassified Sphingomonas]|jgi:LysR family transcriptional regulator, glycine cleavage system transcriptional activator|uniref:LysR family transcriptional regulator n=1 Tax=unclassified Sphingomonas TaxID=196159 RepID=UPI000E0FFF73|nr:LysR substrate-binding domain-containing protein [Sphingomonas sp. FARSPH]AXJ96460.1 hypothetical protein DM480_14160 [Sphingomonas sp. FARSPH]
MLRKTPPLEAIEAFVSVAHAGGLRAGAVALALSPSGASRRITSLEGFLGVALFDRSGPGLRLTPAGERYLALIEPAVASIGRATTMLGADPDRITLATSHSMATHWVAPRLARLKQEEGIDLDVVPTRDPDILRSGEAQLALWGGVEIADLQAEPIIHVDARPVCAPHLADGRASPAEEAALTDYPLLGVREPHDMWSRWLAGAGLAGEQPIRSFATLGMMYEAAAAGMGVALAVPMLCERPLAAGLLTPCGRALPTGERYRLYRAGRRAARSPAETRLAHWLKREATASRVRFDALSA